MFIATELIKELNLISSGKKMRITNFDWESIAFLIRDIHRFNKGILIHYITWVHMATCGMDKNMDPYVG